MEGKTSKAMAVHETGEVLKPWEFPLRSLGEFDVELKVTHAGVCFSDIHTAKGDWGKPNLPLVPGHEIVGFVTAVGGKVSKLKVGDRIGVGVQQLSCNSCRQCKASKEIYCPSAVFTYGNGSTYPGGYISKGGYAEFHRVHEDFAFPLPDGIPSEKAAPLLCAGATVWSPLLRFGAGPTKKVAIVGIGGLGHLAIQFASKLGATVAAISTSANKEKEALELGADIFINSTDDLQLLSHEGFFDLIIVTSNHAIDYSFYSTLLDVDGIIVQLGGHQGKIDIDPFPLMFKRQGIFGSLVASPKEIEAMLTFSAKHKVFPLTESFPLDKVNEVWKKVIENQIRYRAVLLVDPQYKP